MADSSAPFNPRYFLADGICANTHRSTAATATIEIPNKGQEHVETSMTVTSALVKRGRA